ncbi:HNH endonuclease [Corynebacterium glyciniphilum]|uniref:HNH endonuclease n=1 Tax=Corynebacterium glyciniphilum TaxID=1404244 RepID=UPI003FD19138
MTGGRWNGRKATQLTALVLAIKGTICHLCGMPGADTADHIIPRSLGGTDDLDNLMPAHKRCNSSRGAMLLEEWFKKHPLPRRAKASRRW